MPTSLHIRLAATLFFTVAAAAATDPFANYPWIPYDHPAIQYMNPPADRVGKLQKQLESGEIKLQDDPRRGYLPDVLRRLDINSDSQVLVFSKTSFQAPRISPKTPRALYFRDDVLVGSVQNGEVLEIMSLDPRQGVQFYTLSVHQTPEPAFLRRDMVCLQCHMSPATLNVPGLLITSSYTGTDGTPAFRGAQDLTDHRTPLADRWGGWYVSGTSGDLLHRGNAVAPDPHSPKMLDTSGSQNLTSLERKFETAPYLEPTSDIVALMTLEHQTRITNLMIRFAWETRVAIAGGMPAAFQKRLDSDVDELVKYMVFADEAPIRDPIRGVSTFTKTFPQRGPRDRKGRSLRDFDLHTRLFRYPLSYMIYSDAFDALPDLLREKVYRKLHEVLTGTAGPLPGEVRRNVLEILQDTKSSLPAWWKEGS